MSCVVILYSTSLLVLRVLMDAASRLRGYYGISMMDSYYGDLEHKTIMHEWSNVNLDTYAKEWPDAWIGIDSDKPPSKDKF